MLKSLVQQLAGFMGYEISRKSSDWNRRCWPAWTSQPVTSYETDSWFHQLYDLAQTKTQMEETDNAFRRQRHYTLNHLLQNSLTLPHGDICEVGCWRGLSAYQIAYRVREAGKQVALHVFDSFEGLSEYSTMDLHNGQDVDSGLTKRVRKQFACPLTTVQENLAEFDFIRFYPGWVPERFGEVDTARFSFVHIDVDLYQPTKDSFSFFYPRLIENGIMVFDDYGYTSFPGAQEAIDEALQQVDSALFVPLPSSQAFLIKTPAKG